ncbi:hypothetical protein [Paenibacillus sp. YN15]|uniref:hypothetical protein n=1 Tax=Paenibacillus sp. YN15 TaxID=1742774 RepID=UPI000DCF55F0|nr:hypothetical protein [Paenibacillus sp. YN15]RAU99511.1 hypothetical protein DQG13_15555 [Paenibacillus sp. YN15]
MAGKAYVSINGDVTEVVKGKQYPKHALIFSPIEKSPKDYRKQKELAYEEVSSSIERMIEKISNKSITEYLI